MKFKESLTSKAHPFLEKKFSFCTLYYLENIVVSEIDYGIHFDWEKIQELIDDILLHYGEDCKIGYVSNKINSYSFEPNLWKHFFEKYSFLAGIASVCYTKINYINGLLEEKLSNKKVKAVKSLEEVIA